MGVLPGDAPLYAGGTEWGGGEDGHAPVSMDVHENVVLVFSTLVVFNPEGVPHEPVPV